LFSTQARQRPCSFYKDGSLELDQQEELEQLSEPIEEITVDTNNQQDEEEESQQEDDDGRILFADTTAANHNKLKRRGPLMESRISNILGSLGENMRRMSTGDNDSLAGKLLNSTDSFGNFIMWMPEPSLPSRYSGSIEMPTRDIQMALIDQFFNERYESIVLIPRFYFYEQLESKGLLITPLLLNIIYAHASRFVTIPGCPKTEVFYQRARRLVDDFMDVPRVSTVVALYLLSLYEPSPAIYRPGSYHCRQWQYSGMACRMALELGLHDDSNIHSSLTPVEIETRRRVFWGCYDLDKFQSGGWERPWMISQPFIKTLPPSPLPEETEEDRLILNVYIYKVRFMLIMEEGLVLVCASQSFQTGGPSSFLGIHKDELHSYIAENHTKNQQWLRSLPVEMQWTPITTISVKDVLDLPAPRPMVAHIHLYYNAIALRMLLRIPSNSVIQFQARVTAACITQLVYHLCQAPSFILKFDFLVHALISAIKTHLRYLDDPDINLAQQAWLLFDRSIWCMQLINSYAVIPNCTKFLQQVQNIYGLNLSAANSTTSRAGSKSSSPKRPRSSSSIRLGQQYDVSPPSIHQPVPLTKDSNRTDKSGSGGINSSLSTSDPVQFTNNLNHNIPTYLTDWASTTLSQQEQHHANIQLRGASNNSQGMVYLDQQYGFPNTHHPRSSSPSFPNPTYKHTDISKGSTNSNASNQLWHHHQRHQPNGFEQHYNMNNPNEYQQNTNRGDMLGYNTNEIVVPSQLMVDEATEATMYQTPSPSLQQRRVLTDNPSSSSSSSSAPNYVQQSNNILWQNHTTTSMNNSSSTTNQNMNMAGKK
jgi:hypothetical protein